MKKILILVLTVILLVNCKKQQEIDVDFVTTKFKEYSNTIEKVTYNIQKIDTFAHDGFVWNNKGVALIEKVKNDKLFGFSFYGKRNDIEKEYLYDNGYQFVISKINKKYKISEGELGLMGTPGGQMIIQNIFYLDSVYKSVSLIETENKYILKYTFENDTVYDFTNNIKTVELRKNNFFPVKVTRTSKNSGKRAFSQTILSDIKINEQVENSIKKYKNEFKDFEIIQPKKDEPNKLLNKELPKIGLSNLLDQSEIINLPVNKLLLIDFWEVWCAPCIASFPKVENLKNTYSPELEVIGIVSEDFEDAIKLIDRKKTTFLNLVGNVDLKKQFSVNSFPRYFLIDQHGIVIKEYFGFTAQIEKDIKDILEK